MSLVFVCLVSVPEHTLFRIRALLMNLLQDETVPRLNDARHRAPRDRVGLREDEAERRRLGDGAQSAQKVGRLTRHALT